METKSVTINMADGEMRNSHDLRSGYNEDMIISTFGF